VTWLLVEDETDIRNIVAMMMMAWGERPLTLTDGYAAWRWLDSVASGSFADELPELALMDIRMPGYTGDKIAARMRQIPTLKHIPVVLMTAFTLNEMEMQQLKKQSGADYILNKPLPDFDDFGRLLYSIRNSKHEQNVTQ
jgi:CheY-like chemotaxis protein